MPSRSPLDYEPQQKGGRRFLATLTWGLGVAAGLVWGAFGALGVALVARDRYWGRAGNLDFSVWVLLAMAIGGTTLAVIGAFKIFRG